MRYEAGRKAPVFLNRRKNYGAVPKAVIKKAAELSAEKAKQ